MFTFIHFAKWIHIYRYSYAVLLARVLCDNMQCMKFLRKCIPNVIPHAWSEVASRKSEVYPQAVRVIHTPYKKPGHVHGYSVCVKNLLILYRLTEIVLVSVLTFNKCDLQLFDKQLAHTCMVFVTLLFV